jgi:hypothetical protein
MTTTTLTKAALLEKRADLENRFAALSPELELTVRDPELGVEGYVVVWTTLAAEGGPHRIDILTHIDGVSFEEVHDYIVRGRVGGLEVLVLALELLIKNKEATGRPKDQVDADELRRLRVQGG